MARNKTLILLFEKHAFHNSSGKVQSGHFNACVSVNQQKPCYPALLTPSAGAKGQIPALKLAGALPVPHFGGARGGCVHLSAMAPLWSRCCHRDVVTRSWHKGTGFISWRWAAAGGRSGARRSEVVVSKPVAYFCPFYVLCWQQTWCLAATPLFLFFLPEKKNPVPHRNT